MSYKCIYVIFSYVFSCVLFTLPTTKISKLNCLFILSCDIFVLMFYRQKIIKEKAVPKIEGYMFEEHDLVRASATECMCNLVLSSEVRQ